MGRKKTIAFQGEHGAFSEEALYSMLGNSTKSIACETFDILIEMVENGQADYGILPIENSLIGSVQNNHDRLLESSLQIIGETNLRIIHCLIGPPESSIKKIKTVYSHPVALDQCRSFLKKHPHLESKAYYDTAGAIKMISKEQKPDMAAIASSFAAKLYNMKIIRKSIEDKKFNYTRFLLLSKKTKEVKGQAKTSIVFSLKNKPGVLFNALSVFALRDVDLTKIESHPSRKRAWQYHFFIDFFGSINEERIKNALRHLKEIAHFVKVLGSYPVWIEPNND